MKKFILLTISAIFLTSCEKEIEFNGEQTDPRLVINSIVDVGQPVKAHVSKSLFFLDNEGTTSAPADTQVELWVNNAPKETLHTADTTYINGRPIVWFESHYCPVVGDIIKITASANGFENVEGTTSALPSSVEFRLADKTVKEIDSYYITYDDEDSALYVYGQMDIIVEITDPNPGKTDLFRLWIQMNDYDIDTVDQYYASNYYVSHEFTDPVFGASIATNDYVDISNLDTRPEGVFSDALFDGGSYQIKVPLYFNLTRRDNTDPDFFQVPVMIEHLSKEYYYYLNTCEQGSEIASFFAEPTQVYSNVTNGFGIVGGRWTDSTWMALPIMEP